MEHFARVGMVFGFPQIARNHLELALSYNQQLIPLEDELKTIQQEEEESYFYWEKISPIKHKVEEECIITVIFAALTVEGYIYDYAARKLGDRFVKEHIDRLDTLSKWVIVPTLVTGKPFPKSDVGFQRLNELIKDRNFIVHNKSENLHIFDQKTSQFVINPKLETKKERDNNLESAKNAIQALDKLALIMEELDKEELTSFFFASPVGKNKENLKRQEEYLKQAS